MILEIVKYGHPVLRKRGEPIKEITPEIKKLIEDMFETMKANNGVGLAAQQVGKALQLMVIDVRDAKDRPSTMEVNGKAVNPDDYMPIALINPKVRTDGVQEKGVEGCLSFPEIYAEITRPAIAIVSAITQNGKEINFKCSGLLSRAIQHELDHLNGILFIDRMDSETLEELQPEIDKIKNSNKSRK